MGRIMGLGEDIEAWGGYWGLGRILGLAVPPRCRRMHSRRISADVRSQDTAPARRTPCARWSGDMSAARCGPAHLVQRRRRRAQTPSTSLAARVRTRPYHAAAHDQQRAAGSGTQGAVTAGVRSARRRRRRGRRPHMSAARSAPAPARLRPGEDSDALRLPSPPACPPPPRAPSAVAWQGRRPPRRRCRGGGCTRGLGTPICRCYRY